MLADPRPSGLPVRREGGMGLDTGCGCAGSSTMVNIWRAAGAGDLVEVERLEGHDRGLLDARDGAGRTPLIWASEWGHVGVVRWLLDKGAAIDHTDNLGSTALWFASCCGRTPVVKLLLERGADPAIAFHGGWTPLMAASQRDHLEVVRVLLGHPDAKATVNHRDNEGQTALRLACYWGFGGIVRALLENGADLTIAHNDGTTPLAIAKQPPPPHRADITAEGRRDCVAALEVSFCFPLSLSST
jgi:ankyrin repeat protein